MTKYAKNVSADPKNVSADPTYRGLSNWGFCIWTNTPESRYQNLNYSDPNFPIILIHTLISVMYCEWPKKLIKVSVWVKRLIQNHDVHLMNL